MTNKGKPYIPRKINIDEIQDKELIKCKCGNSLFAQRIQLYKFIDQEQIAYAHIIASVCSKCDTVLPEKP